MLTAALLTLALVTAPIEAAPLRPYRAQAESIVAEVTSANDCLLPTGVEWWETALSEQAALGSVETSVTP